MRDPHGRASALSVRAAALVASPRVVDLDARVAGLVPAVAAGFALQTLTGALIYLLPVVFGRGAWGNRAEQHQADRVVAAA